MANKITFKLLIVLAGLLTVGAAAVGVMAFMPEKTANAQTVQILDVMGNVKYFDSEADTFVAAPVGQNMVAGQPMVTGSESWIRLSMFDDGTAIHIEQYSSLTLLNIGEEEGQPFVSMKLDIGGVYLVPRRGIVYIQTPEGTAFADAPGAVLYVQYSPQTGMGVVSCLEGVCKLSAGGSVTMLSAGQQAALGGSNSPVVDAIDQPELVKILEQEETRGLGGIVGSANGPQSADGGNPADNAIAANLKLLAQGPKPTRVKKTKQPPPSKASPTPEPTKIAATNGPTKSVPTNLPTKTQLPEPTQQPTQAPTKAPTKVPTQVATKQPTQAPTEIPESGELRSPDLVRDDQYHSNPGIGWQYRGGEYPTKYPEESVAYAPRSEVSWRVLNPAEGIYNWAALDSNLNYVISQGKQFSFRVYTMRGEGYGGHQVPDWVVNKGARILPGGEVDYSNCVYQQEWGKFVNKLIQRYDGNPDIAFIDISGYGNFNEWSWQDQTYWDETWADAYKAGNANRGSMTEIDSFARRRLADMFIGGSYNNHQCRDSDGNFETVSYSYSGFSRTQLLMPYAGVIQSSQYVHLMDRTVGFRHDCLGRESANKIVSDDRLGKELSRIWPNAPVVYETCGYEFNMSNAEYLLKRSHASLVHDVNVGMGSSAILKLAPLLGYKYELLTFSHNYRIAPGGKFQVYMEWQNTGSAPSYPRMGQDFEMHVYFYNSAGEQVVDILVNEDISRWMPAATSGGTPPTYVVEVMAPVAEHIPGGIYSADVKIIDKRTGESIWVPVEVGGFEYRNTGSVK